MIFIVLGTQKFQMNRLLKIMEQYVETGVIKEEVVAQRGNSDYVPKNYMSYEFMDKETFDTMIATADIVVTHGGVGSIITALNAKRPIVVFPRMLKHKEHVDNHQIDIAEAFERKDYVICCREQDELSECIEKARTKVFAEYISQREKVVEIIQQFLNNIDRQEA